MIASAHILQSSNKKVDTFQILVLFSFDFEFNANIFEVFLNYQHHKVGISANCFFPTFSTVKFISVTHKLVENAT